MEKEWLRLLNEAQNFFKHADIDSNGILEFSPEQTESFLYDATRIYMELTREKPSNMIVFRTWFFLKNPQMLAEPSKQEFSKIGWNPNDKSKAFDFIKFIEEGKTP